MAFGFFRRAARGDAPAPGAPPEVAREEDAVGDGDEGDSDDLAADADDGAWEVEGDGDEDAAWRARALAVIPGGASTGSKRADALYGPGDDAGPTHFVSARGAHVVTAGGRTLLDCTMALGAVALGYRDDLVTRAVVDAAAAGHVSGLSSTLEVEVAERLCALVPVAERVRFLKTGAGATAAAVRVARAATGRAKVVASGYFGWLDWCSDGPGVTAGVRADVALVPPNDVAALERAARAAGSDLAAIVIEPVVERLPDPAWPAAARRLCDELGALLVFDEIKTGFRLHAAGWQGTASAVAPDLATYGKAMANGFPLAALAGRAAPMDEAFARGAWVSSTLAGEATALAAAAAVLARHEDEDVCAALAVRGAALLGAVETALRASGARGVALVGLPQMWLLRFDAEPAQRRFLEVARDEGVLFKRGAYNYASLAHDDDAVADAERAASSAFVALCEEGLA